MPKLPSKLRSILGVDTEVTGLDLHHGAKPFILSSCDGNGNQLSWIWDVDPETRQPIIPKEDLIAVREHILSYDELALQNPKFDVGAIETVDPEFAGIWPWDKTRCTLMGGHLLVSNQAHDLTTMALVYLDLNIEPFEIAMKKACNLARNIARKYYPTWRIAQEGLPEMPSAKGETKAKKGKGEFGSSPWKFDMWLPRAIIKQVIHDLNFSRLPDDRRQPTVGRVNNCTVRIDRQTKWGNPFVIGKDGTREEVIQKYAAYIWNSELINDLPELYHQRLGCHCAPDLCHGQVLRALCHPWMDVTAEYAIADPSATVELYKAQERLIKDRNLWEIYKARLELLPVIYKMERRGITLSEKRSDGLEKDYQAESQRLRDICTKIASSRGYDLTLPKSGNNNSLVNFVFNPTKEDTIFVFGSNREGRHGKGAALEARTHWGARYGQAEGLQGNSYAIITKELRPNKPKVTLQEIQVGVERFKLFAKANPDKAFKVSPIGCGLAGFTPKQIAPLFEGSPKNVHLPKEFGGKVEFQPGLGVLPTKVSKQTGQPSFDKYVIDDIVSDSIKRFEQDPDLYPLESDEYVFGTSIKDMRARDTALTFLKAYRRFRLPLETTAKWIPVKVIDEVTGAGWYVIHPSFNPTGAGTLRFSSSNPNAQNISKRESFNLRYCFGPAPGREWWSCDASNIELRIPAYEAGESEMIHLFEKPNDPPYYGGYHLMIFDTLHPEKFAIHGKNSKKEYAATWYQWTKNGNFAVQYGAQEESGTADKAYHVPGAQRKIQSRFKNIARLNQSQIAHAEKYGYVETMIDRSIGAKRGYPLYCTRTKYGIKPTVPLSYHVQSTAMWWMCRAMVRCQKFLDDINNGEETFRKFMGRGKTEAEKEGYFLIIQIHDELVFDFPKNYKSIKMPGNKVKEIHGNLPIIREIQRLMSLGGSDIGVPTPVGCEYHPDNFSVGLSV